MNIFYTLNFCFSSCFYLSITCICLYLEVPTEQANLSTLTVKVLSKFIVSIVAFEYHFGATYYVFPVNKLRQTNIRRSCDVQKVHTVYVKPITYFPKRTFHLHYCIGHKLIAHNTFQRRPGCVLTILCKFKLCPVSMGNNTLKIIV